MRTALDTFSGFLAVTAAVFFDLFQFMVSIIPFAGSVLAKLVSIAAAFVFFMWLLLSGELNVKTFLWLVGAGSLELLPIPFLDMGPFWTGGIALLAGMIVLKHARQGRSEQRSAREQQMVAQREMEEEYARGQEEQQQAAFNEEEQYAMQMAEQEQAFSF